MRRFGRQLLFLLVILAALPQAVAAREHQPRPTGSAKKRNQRRLLAIPSRYGAGVLDFLNSNRHYDGALVSEAHVGAADITGECERLLRKGWYADFAPSQQTPKSLQNAEDAADAEPGKDLGKLYSGEGGTVTLCKSHLANEQLGALTELRDEPMSFSTFRHWLLGAAERTT